MSNLPNVPINLDQPLRDFLMAVGNGFKYLNQSIEDLSVVARDEMASQLYEVSDYVTRMTDNTAVDPPSNLTVSVEYLTHTLTWDNLDDHERIMGVEVFCNYVNDVSTASLIATVTYDVREYKRIVPAFGVDYYYWIRNVTWGGGYSTFVPDPITIGGFLVPGPESAGQAIDEAMNILLGTDPPLYNSGTEYAAGDIVKWQNADGNLKRYRRLDYSIGASGVPPSNTSYWEKLGILIEGEVGGIPTIGIDGDLVVDGSILGRMIAADQINGTHINATSSLTLSDGGELTIGHNGLIEVLSGGTLKLGDGGLMSISGGNWPDAGLYMNQDYMGYWNGSNWTAFISNAGLFQFLGNASNKITWDGSVLAVRGLLNADDIITGSLAGTLITANTIYANRIVANDIAVASYYDLPWATVTAVTPIHTELTTSNTSLVGSFNISNTNQYLPLKILIIGIGQMASTIGNQHFAYAFFRNSTKLFDSEWMYFHHSADWCVTDSIPANTTYSYSLRATQDYSANLQMRARASIFGAKN